MRPVSAAVPDGLSVITYLSMGTPAWAPYIPLYKGLPADKVPRALAGVRYGSPDSTSLFWKSRRLCALMFQDWPKVGPAAEAAITQFDADVEAGRPAMEAQYAAAVEAGKQADADQVLADWTAATVDAVRRCGAGARGGGGGTRLRRGTEAQLVHEAVPTPPTRPTCAAGEQAVGQAGKGRGGAAGPELLALRRPAGRVVGECQRQLPV